MDGQYIIIDFFHVKYVTIEFKLLFLYIMTQYQNRFNFVQRNYICTRFLRSTMNLYNNHVQTILTLQINNTMNDFFFFFIRVLEIKTYTIIYRLSTKKKTTGTLDTQIN